MNSKNFYYKYNKDKDLYSIFCIVCHKIAYSTKENKYMKDQHFTNFNNLQCLNSSCRNGFSTTYQYCVVPNTSKKKKREILLESELVSTTKNMERFSLN